MACLVQYAIISAVKYALNGNLIKRHTSG